MTEPITSELRWPRLEHVHRVRTVSDLMAFYPKTYLCMLCDEERPAGRMVTDGDTTMWWESIDWDGRVLARDWRGGPRRRHG